MKVIKLFFIISIKFRYYGNGSIQRKLTSGKLDSTFLMLTLDSNNFSRSLKGLEHFLIVVVFWKL